MSLPVNKMREAKSAARSVYHAPRVIAPFYYAQRVGLWVHAKRLSSMALLLLVLSASALDELGSPGILTYVNDSAVFRYQVWTGTNFLAAADGPAMQGTDVIRHIRSASSDDGSYVAVLAESYAGGIHNVYGTVWDSQALQWIDTTNLWTFDDTVDEEYRSFDVAALSSNEFVAAGKNELTTVNNAGWKAGSGWTVETVLTTVGDTVVNLELARRPGTRNMILLTKDESEDTNMRYYMGADPYGSSANVNTDWTANRELVAASDAEGPMDAHAFFCGTNNTIGGILMNDANANATTIRCLRFTCDATTFTSNSWISSAAMADDYNKSIVVPVPLTTGTNHALVAAVNILESLQTFRVSVANVRPSWTTITTVEANAGMHLTGLCISYDFAMEFDGTRGVLMWARTGVANTPQFSRWTIGGAFAAKANVTGAPVNGYDRMMIARRDPVRTNEICFVVVSDVVGVNTVWWNGTNDAFYSTGDKAWTEQAAGLSTLIEDSFGCVDFQFYKPLPNLYFRRAGPTWNTATNWSYLSGAEAWVTLPSSSYSLFFDANSANCTSLFVAATARSIDTTGYTNTLMLGTNNLSVVSNLTHAGGTITIGASASVGLDVDGSITNSAAITCSGASKINCKGNWDGSAGTNTASTSRVTLDGTNAQMITTGGAWNGGTNPVGTNNWKNNWYWLDIQNTSTSGVIFADGFKATNFSCTQTVAALLYFAPQIGFTNVFEITGSNGLKIVGGTLAADYIKLRRYGGVVGVGERWEIYPSYTNTGTKWTVNYVNVADSVNSASNSISPVSKTDSGNNTNWFGAPTYVSLGWFEAIGRDNSVTVRWKTECEVNIAWFNLYRSTSEAGPYTNKVNDSVIWGLGTSSRGREYKYVDLNVVNGTTYYYKLESVEFSGRSTWYGPREAHPGLDSDGDGMTDDWENFYFHNLTNNAGGDFDDDGLTNYEEFLADTNPDDAADDGGWVGGAAATDGNSGIYRMEVKTNGIYRITADYLTNTYNAGVTNLDNWVMDSISVYNQGSEIPLRVHDEGAAGFGSNDWFEFYGTGLVSRFTDANIYWLYPGITGTNTGTNTGLRMPEISGVSGEGVAVKTSEWFTAHYEQNEWYQQFLPDDEVPDDDHWFFSNWLVTPAGPLSTTNLNLVLTNVAAEEESAVVRVALQGVEEDLTAHHVQVAINGVSLTNEADNGCWDWSTQYIFSVETSQTNLVGGTNVVAVTLLGDTAAAVLINWVEIDYKRALQAVSNSLIFSASEDGAVQYSIAGYTTNDVQVFRVVNATNVSVITNTDLSIEGQVTFTDTLADAEIGATYAVSAPEARLTPAAISEDAASDLRNTLNGADYIIIAYDAFTNAVQPLAEYHALQGLRVKTVALQDVYDDFNFGVFSPYAIRDFMVFARQNWAPPAPTYLLLVGDATYDYRNYANKGSVNYVPAKLVHDSESWEKPSDNWYVALDPSTGLGAGDDYLPDMYVGRLPARTNSEVSTMVNKILNYETNAPPDDWDHKVMLVAGDDEPTFEAINESVYSYLPTNYQSQVNRIYQTGKTAAECKTLITNGINAGALITHYAGHGSIQVWENLASETIFESSDIPSLTNGVGLPFFITLTCDNGYFITPPAIDFESLAEELLRKATNGAIACFSPSGYSASEHQEVIVTNLFGSIFNEGTFSLGRAVTRAKQKAYDDYGDSLQNVVQIFMLFGDPAMKLKGWTEFTNDVTAPWVDLSSPLDGAENVADTAEIRITFSEAMDDVMTRAAFSISPAVAGIFAWEGATLVFQPEDIYSLATIYTVTVKSNACDLAGNRLAADYRFSFARTYPAGMLAIDVTPAAGSWQMESSPATYHGTTNGTGDLSATNATEGTYGIIYNALAGYTAPSAQTQTVHRGVLTTFSGVYNQYPAITEGTSIAVPYGEGDLAQGVSFTLHATDADALTWNIKTPATNGIAAASGTGSGQTIHYQPQSNSRGADMFVVKVTDAAGGEDEITVNVSFNNPPQIGALAGQSVELGGLLAFAVSATDPDGTVPALSMLVYPAGAAFTDHGQGAGTFNWTPGKVTELGDHVVRFAASDGQLSDIKDITIHVTTFTVTSPEENAVARLGGDLDIIWTGQRSLGAVAVDLWRGTNFILNLTNNLPSPANQMTWQTVMPFSIRPGRDYRVALTEANNANNWASSGSFTILLQCPNDFDGDGVSDLSVYNPDAGNWSVYGSTLGFYQMLFDYASVTPVPWDYDGDGKTDFVVYQQKTGNWYMRVRLSDSRYLADTAQLGGLGFCSAAGDYDGDGRMDIAVYHEASGQWYLLLSRGGYSQDSGLTGIFGGPGYRFVAGDYDGDGKTDPVLYQKTSGAWYGLLSDMGYAMVSANLGGPEYQPVSGDFDGDGRSDIAVYQETTGNWYFMLSDSNYAVYSLTIGGPGYVPVPGDYDGDGKTDLVVYQETTGNWSGRLSGSGYATGSTTFGGRPYRAIVPGP